MRRVPASGMMPLALDLDADAGGFRDDSKLFHPDAGNEHARVGKAGGSDALCQRFHEVEMSFRDDGLDAVHDARITDDVSQIVAMRRLGDGQIDIDADGLGAALLMAIDADMGIQQQIMHKDMAHGAFGISDLQRRYIVWQAHLIPYSEIPVTSGVSHARCWPPSSAIIWPVMAGEARINRMAAEISSGVVPRRRIVAAACRSKSAAVWRSLGSVGPGPMAFTRTCGASARARISVMSQSAILL